MDDAGELFVWEEIGLPTIRQFLPTIPVLFTIF
jgi:hypothetical protein